MLDKSKTYLILNYNPSAVALPTKNGSFLMPGGSSDAPSTYPLDINEIHYINNASNAFKIGLLYFEPDFEADIYEELRIRDWKNILRDEQVEEIILNPTVDGLERLIRIQNAMYFERIYGIYMGLRNAGYSISGNVDKVMTLRRKEFADKKINTAIKLRTTEAAADTDAERKIAELEEQMRKLTSKIEGEKHETASEPETTKPKMKRKTAAKKQETGPEETKEE